ncbi:MAG: asparagine synthase-related protein [Methanobacterium sp. ERen5]|nr:MAG: asparagine synthase-related protein [Methanobacterium sp. ERen5]
MSAISGIFYRDGRSVKFEEINNLNDSMSHRGPDKSSIWIDQSVALGHQMMCTTEESLHEKLPFYDEKSGLVITADARLDNRLELADLLNIKDSKNLSDSYYILKSYEKWGENCPKYLLGDFVFVVYDKYNETIFCARDPMGIKVFYYYLSLEKFIFATEIKAILNTKSIPLELNEERIAFYLMDINDNKSTFYKDIHVFSPATSFTIDKNKIKKEIYWKLDPKFSIILDSEDEYIAQFRELFYQAVECRLRSIRPIGFELSGGLDSSSVVCMSKKILNKNSNFHTNLETFSCIFPNFPGCDESEYIKKVVEMGGINSNLVNGDQINPLENISEILFIQEQPFFTPFMNMLWKMYNRMRLNNVGVMLCGVGGDAVVSYGNKLFIDLIRENQWKNIFQELKLYSQQINKSTSEIFLQNIIYPYVPESVKKRFRKKDVKPNSSILDSYYAKKLMQRNI